MRRKFDMSKIDFLDSGERLQTFPPQMILSRLPLSPNQIVADIGCGTGYFSIPLADYLTEGKVYALDLSEEMLRRLKKRLDGAPRPNIVLLKSGEEEIPLEAGSVDGVLMTCVLHEAADDRAAFLEKAFALLKPGGWLAVVEWFKEVMPVGPPVKERIDMDEAISIAPKKGISLVKKEALSDKHYFLLWQKHKEGA